MQKIANSVTGRTVLPAVSTSTLTYASVSQVTFAAATNALTAAAYLAWQAANLTLRPIGVTQIMGNDAIPILLVEYTAEEVSFPLNSVISQTLITGATTTILVAALQTWKTANPSQKIIRVTQMIGLDGGVGLLVEYGSSSTIPNLVNSQISQTFFADSGSDNTSYALYLAWKNTAGNESLKPYRVTYVIADEGNGILVEYTTYGSTPSIGQLQLAYVTNSAVTGGGLEGFANNLQANKTAAPASQIYRITPIYQGFLIETTLNGNTAVNSLVSQASYSATTGITATDALQVFKTANPTLKPVRLTAMTWGDGTNSILSEYIS